MAGGIPPGLFLIVCRLEGSIAWVKGLLLRFVGFVGLASQHSPGSQFPLPPSGKVVGNGLLLPPEGVARPRITMAGKVLSVGLPGLPKGPPPR